MASEFETKPGSSEELVPAEFRDSNGANALEEVISFGIELHQQFPVVTFTDPGAERPVTREVFLEEVGTILRGFDAGFGVLRLDCIDRNIWDEQFGEADADNIRRPKVAFPEVLRITQAEFEEKPHILISSNSRPGEEIINRLNARAIRYQLREELLIKDTVTQEIGTIIAVPVR